MKCKIEVVFSPPRPDLDGIGLRKDEGGFVYRIRDEKSVLRSSGSVSTLDPFKALRRAMESAHRLGFTHWRSQGAGGPYHDMS